METPIDLHLPIVYHLALLPFGNKILIMHD